MALLKAFGVLNKTDIGLNVPLENPAGFFMFPSMLDTIWNFQPFHSCSGSSDFILWTMACTVFINPTISNQCTFFKDLSVLAALKKKG